MIVALSTLLLSVMKFGREVHVDDKQEMIRRLNECEANHRNCIQQNDSLRKQLEEAEREKIRYMKLYFESNGNSRKPDDRRQT